MSARARTTALFFLLVTLVLAFIDKGQITGDGIPRWEALRALAEQGEATSTKYTMAQPLLALPLWYAGAAMAPDGSDEETVARFARRVVQRYNKFVALLLATWVFGFLRRFGLDVRNAALGAMMLLFATMLVPHAKDFYSEPTWTLASLVVIGVVSRWIVAPVGRGDVAAACAAAVLAIWINPVLAPVLGVTVVCALGLRARIEPGFTRRLGPPIGISLATLVAAVLVLLVENVWRRGSALDFGYTGERFSTPLLEGLAGMLVSPARGLLWFVPGLASAALGFARRPPRDVARMFGLLAGAYSIALVLLYAKWHAWHGAWYWGPRFLLPVSAVAAIGMSLAWAKRRERPYGERLLLVASLVLSLLVFQDGAAIGQSPLVACLASTGNSSHCFWEWRFSPYAALLDSGALRRVLEHRSTLVLGAAALLFVAWWKGAGARRS